MAKGWETPQRDLMPVTPEVLEQERPPPQTLAEVIEKLDRVTQEAARLSQLASFLLKQAQHTAQPPPVEGGNSTT